MSMEIYYKVDQYSAPFKGHRVYFTNSIFMHSYDKCLHGISLTYNKCNIWYSDRNNRRNVYNNFIIPLSLEEINDTIEKYGNLL